MIFVEDEKKKQQRLNFGKVSQTAVSNRIHYPAADWSVVSTAIPLLIPHRGNRKAQIVVDHQPTGNNGDCSTGQIIVELRIPARSGRPDQ